MRNPLFCGGIWHIQSHYISGFSSHSWPALDPSFHQKVALLPNTKTPANALNRPFSLISMILAALLTTFMAIYLDTKFYTDHTVNWAYLFSHPTITPLNNLRYNLQPRNLATHGLHPWYQHLLLNIPQLLGPAALLLFIQPHLSLRLYSAISGVFVLSIIQHQEARFLLPTIPLILSSVQLPKNRMHLRIWAAVWVAFNVFFGLLMGVYHQGGVIPAQVFLSKQPDATTAIWWKTYSPPVWLLNGKNEVLATHDIMGMKGPLMLQELVAKATCQSSNTNETAYLEEKEGTYLIAPLSATFLDNYTANLEPGARFQEVWRYEKHLNLDDLDFGDDGVFPTLKRVIGRRGLAAWRVTKPCRNR
jgi:phosphatidylinositol glycan class Z